MKNKLAFVVKKDTRRHINWFFYFFNIFLMQNEALPTKFFNIRFPMYDEISPEAEKAGKFFDKQRNTYSYDDILADAKKYRNFFISSKKHRECHIR